MTVAGRRPAVAALLGIAVLLGLPAAASAATGPAANASVVLQSAVTARSTGLTSAYVQSADVRSAVERSAVERSAVEQAAVQQYVVEPAGIEPFPAVAVFSNLAAPRSAVGSGPHRWHRWPLAIRAHRK